MPNDEFVKNSNNNVERQLKELDKEIRKCKKCCEREQFPNNLPTVQFNSTNDILFIGRDPAKDGWRKSGKAFFKQNGTMISSGKIFSKQLKTVGVDIEKINFVELVKCFPKGDKFRPPKKNEIRYCSYWLYRQIDIIQPKIIVPMGKECCEFFNDTKINSFSAFIDSGKYIQYRNIEVIPIFHPSGANNKFNQRNFIILKKIIVKIGGV